MTYFQIMMIVIGVVIALSAFWEKVVEFIPKSTPKIDTTPEQANKSNENQSTKNKPEEHSGCENACFSDLTEIVHYWENLRIHCEEYNLIEAKTELEKIFPLLVKVSKPASSVPELVRTPVPSVSPSNPEGAA